MRAGSVASMTGRKVLRASRAWRCTFRVGRYACRMTSQIYNFEQRAECPACGSGDAATRFASSFDHPAIARVIVGTYKIDPAILSRGKYRLDQCGSCETIYQVDVGDTELLTALYSSWVYQSPDPEEHADYAYDVSHPRMSRDAHEIMAASSYLGIPTKDLKTLDFGMGFAGWARIAAHLGCRSFGSDISTNRMDFARKHGVNAILDSEIENHRFHFINTEQAMEHMTDPAAVTERLASVLLPGGVLKISVPSQQGAEQVIDKLNGGVGAIGYEEIVPVYPLEHVNNFTREGLAALGNRFGLVPVLPSLIDRYSFLTKRGALDFRNPKRLLKELVRPFYHHRNPRNLYVWLRKPT